MTGSFERLWYIAQEEDRILHIMSSSYANVPKCSNRLRQLDKERKGIFKENDAQRNRMKENKLRL